MKNIYLYITLILLSLYSCSDWLDVAASDQMKESQLFEKGQGYRNALLGIYQELSTEKLYGQQMTWGMLDAMGQLYDPSSIVTSSEFIITNAAKYDYKNSYVKEATEKIWTSMYLCIANCNNLIANIESASPSIFEYKEEEKNMITGEAYALRGFLHFDLLRLFAPSLAAGGDGNYIPYCDTYPAIYNKRLSVKEVLNKIIADLEKAQDLTAQDTMPDNIEALQRVRCRVENENYFQERGIFWGYRCTRMNYLNITGILARVYLYAGELEKANNEAQYVLDFEGIDFPSKYGGYSGNSKSRNDILLAFFNKRISETYEAYTGGDCGYLKLKNLDELYSNETADKRYSEMIKEVTKSTRMSAKYIKYTNNSDERVNGPLIPVLRKAEMYHIVCEYLVSKERLADAIQLLNDLRYARGLPFSNMGTNLSKDEFLGKLRLDAHKEFVSEGQVFFMYKRLNQGIWDGKNGTISPDYVLPIPDGENI